MRMSAFSNRKNSAFEGLTLKQVRNLLNVLENKKIRTYSLVKNAFSDYSINFDNTLDFLCRIGAVKKRKDSYTIAEELPPSASKNLNTYILNIILISQSSYREEIFRFVNCFKVFESEVSYRSPDDKKSSESAVRNFLIEMNIIHYESKNSRYIFSNEFIYLFVNAHNEVKRISPAVISSANEANEVLGCAAEEVIVKYEKDRVGAKLVHHIKHIAQTNAAAGYDICSITENNEQPHAPRFIEVKAVPKISYRYYWSHNEMAVSQDLGDWYYLYLLPVTTEGNFDLDNLLIIKNPSNQVLGPTSDWVSEPDVLRCYLQPTDTINH